MVPILNSVMAKESKLLSFRAMTWVKVLIKKLAVSGYVVFKFVRQNVKFYFFNNCRSMRDFMKDLSNDNQADITKAFDSTSRYLDDLLNFDNPYFEGMVNQIYPPKLQLNKAITSDTPPPPPPSDLHHSISDGIVSSKIYDKPDEFDFDIVNFPFLDGDVPCRPFYRV